MTRIFADSCYWIALLHRNDQLHVAADAARKQLRSAHIVTTDEVLSEVLNFFSARGKEVRAAAAQVVEDLRIDSRVTVVEQSRATFDGGLGRYKQFGDKEWSLADCVSFELMTRDSIGEALTNDHHFEQAGFTARLRENGP
ncbi:MAG TPA: PIN domain-containing protein [Lacipirellulaceae bacterium]|jgi:predicted nucleic acid-binding protein|nr:PIN domain-containing protein [Lacipirellulaceae bacterium]